MLCSTLFLNNNSRNEKRKNCENKYENVTQAHNMEENAENNYCVSRGDMIMMM